MRSYTHYAFRDAVRAAMASGTFFASNPLVEDCSWTQAYYGPGFRSRQRTYFSRSASRNA